jgi:hypothetical protein
MMSRALALLTGVVLVSACSAAGVPARWSGHEPGHKPGRDLRVQPGSAGVPGIIRASVASSGPRPGLVYLAPGTRVSGASIGVRTAGAGRVLYGLADQGAMMGTVWPAISTDAGRHWRIDGPLFSYAGADGAAATDAIGARGASMAWAWGGGGNLVKVTTDSGRQWWLADFPAGVSSVRWQAGHLTVWALRPGSGVSRYVSPDNGRTWRLS